MIHMTVYAENLRMTHDCPEGNRRVHSETCNYLRRQPACAAKIFSKKKTTSNKVLNMPNYKSKEKKTKHTQNKKRSKG